MDGALARRTKRKSERQRQRCSSGRVCSILRWPRPMRRVYHDTTLLIVRRTFIRAHQNTPSRLDLPAPLATQNPRPTTLLAQTQLAQGAHSRPAKPNAARLASRVVLAVVVVPVVEVVSAAVVGVRKLAELPRRVTAAEVLRGRRRVCLPHLTDPLLRARHSTLLNPPAH